MKKIMNKQSLFLLLCCVFGCMAYSFFRFSKKEDGTKKIRIALFQPATHPALEEIAQGFMDTMQNDTSFEYQFDRYNANGNKILMQAQGQEILTRNYDLIFTIGLGCSVTIKDIKKGILHQWFLLLLMILPSLICKVLV